MEKDPQVFLRHILDSIEIVERYSKGKRKSDFLQSLDLQDKIIRRLTIIGEAIRNIPEAIRSANADIPWKAIAGTRDKLIHEYFGVDLSLTWHVVKHDLPTLKKQITAMKKILEEQ